MVVRPKYKLRACQWTGDQAKMNRFLEECGGLIGPDGQKGKGFYPTYNKGNEPWFFQMFYWLFQFDTQQELPVDMMVVQHHRFTGESVEKSRSIVTHTLFVRQGEYLVHDNDNGLLVFTSESFADNYEEL